MLAKEAVENYIEKEEIIPSPQNLPEEILKKKAGVFVTVEKEGELRGCIGTYLPTRINIAEETIHNAVAAASEDYRFGQIKKEELPLLSYTVSILSYPEEVNGLKELDPKKFGIIVKTSPFVYPSGSEEEKREQALFDHPSQENVVGEEDKSSSLPFAAAWVFDGHAPFKSGLLLPDLPGVDSAEKQFLIACDKGQIDPAREKVFIYRFTVEKHE